MPTVDPDRLRILKALTAALSEINPDLSTRTGSVYVNDMRPSPEAPEGRVFRGRVLFGDKDPLPMISILEVPLPPEQIESPPDSPDRTGPWDLILQGFLPDDIENPTDPAHILLADVVMRLAVEKRRQFRAGIFGMPNLVIGMSIGVGVVRPPDEISDKAYFWLPLRLTIAESLDDPYSGAV